MDDPKQQPPPISHNAPDTGELIEATKRVIEQSNRIVARTDQLLKNSAVYLPSETQTTAVSKRESDSAEDDETNLRSPFGRSSR